MASNWKREHTVQKPFKIPEGWDKGEPLTVHKISETCYRLYRSGAYVYLNTLRSRPVTALYLEFRSRVEMQDFQEWWDAPQHAERVMLTRQEYLEYVQEMLEFHPRRGSVHSILPGSPRNVQLVAEVTEQEAEMLRDYHSRYCAEVAQVLNIRD